ncbi:MAG: hypothetical protein ACLFTZ_01090 [Acholeplasmataceae bacterium]
MNRKLILFSVLTFSVLSIMAIAVFGTLPEGGSSAPVEAILIPDYDEENSSGERFKDVNGIVTERNNVYEVEYAVEPGEAEGDIQASSNNGGMSVQVDQQAGLVYVYYDTQAIGQTVTIRIWDDQTKNQAEIILWFKTPGSVTVPD